MRLSRTWMAGAALITERFTNERKFQARLAAGPDLVRLMLAPSSRMEAITKRPPSSDQMLGRTVHAAVHVGDGLRADGGVFVDDHVAPPKSPGP